MACKSKSQSFLLPKSIIYVNMRHMAKTSKHYSFHITPAMIILLGFAGVILVGAFLLCLPISNTSGKWLPFVDSLFTSTTSVCVTGLMVFDIAAELNLFGQIVVMLLVQIGGLGFVSMASFIFLLLRKKINYSTRLTLQESLNKEDNQGVVNDILKILLITLICEFVGFLMLLPSMIVFTGSAGSGIFKALFLAISAFCNAGIDPLGTLTPEFSNLAYFANKSWVLIPVMMLVVVGGIGFLVILDLFDKNRKQRKINLHTRVVLIFTSALILFGAVVTMVCEWNNTATIGGLSVWDKIVNSFFQSVTTRTAGFATFDQGSMNQVTIIVSQILMFIGGSPASFAGGMKTTTLFVLLLMLFKSTTKDGDLIYRNKKITHQTINKAARIVLIGVMFIFVGSLLVFVFEGMKISYGVVLFESVSAICTVGLSLGITPMLSVGSKLVLIMLMYIGRIGMLTIPLAFKTKENLSIDYVEAKIVVG